MKMSTFFHYVLMFTVCLYTSCICTYSLIQEEEQYHSVCTEEPILKGNGTIKVTLNKGCKIYAYVLEAQANSSIFSVSIAATPNNNSSEIFADTTENVSINLTENATILASWTLNSSSPFKRYAVSRTYHVRVTFMVNAGNCSGSEILLNYQEITFETIFKKISNEDGGGEIQPDISIEGRSYRPNSVYIFQITNPENWASNNVMITLNSLDIDEEIGEYLLIGAGLEPFEGPPPLFISYFQGVKQYFVNDENAYIAFVARATRKDHKGFYVTWNHTGIKIGKKEEIENEDILESAPICIYNVQAAQAEFNKSGIWFKEFRTKLAIVASKYAKENLSREEDNSISFSSISVFQVLGLVPVNETNKALYAMVKISEKSQSGKAAFNRFHLERIIDIYARKHSQDETDIYQFGTCPPKKLPGTWGNAVFYLIVPIICCIFLLIWTWKQNPVLEYFAKQKRIKRFSQAQTHTKYYQEECTTVAKTLSENPYSSLPKLQVVNDDGRRYTLNVSDALLSEGDQSEDEVFNKVNTPRMSTRVLQRRKETPITSSTKRPEINPAFELEEDCINELNAHTQQERDEPTEHMYDSVKSTSSLHGNRNDVIETKL